MKKILLMILLLILSSACAAKDINIITVKLDNKLNEVIFSDTINILNRYVKPDVSNLIIYSKENKFLNTFEQHLRIAGYAVLVTPKEINTKENDYIFGYILDTVDKKKVNKRTVKTIRYSFILNSASCSRLYEINTTDNELLFKSDWTCYTGA